jgi:hypothetical protein
MSRSEHGIPGQGSVESSDATSSRFDYDNVANLVLTNL